jgi:hypothetical protein
MTRPAPVVLGGRRVRLEAPRPVERAGPEVGAHLTSRLRGS